MITLVVMTVVAISACSNAQRAIDSQEIALTVDDFSHSMSGGSRILESRLDWQTDSELLVFPIWALSWGVDVLEDFDNGDLTPEN